MIVGTVAPAGRCGAGLTVAALVVLAGCQPVAPATPQQLAWPMQPLVPDPALAVLAGQVGSACQPQVRPNEPFHVLLEDRRAPGIASFLIASNAHFGSCILMRTGTGTTGGSESGDLPAAEFTGIALDAGGTDVLETGAGIASYRGGRADPTVASVSVSLPDGRVVVATVGSGYWLASWQGDAIPSKLVATDGSGNVIATIENPK